MIARRSVADNSELYSVEDFEKVNKIDMHVHINSADPALVELAERDRFKLLTINADYSVFPPIEEQLKLASSFRKRFPERIAYASTFTMNGWDDTGWQDKTIEHIERTLADGACAVKVWKNVGMEFRDRSGRLVMIDNPRLDPIFSYLRRKNIPLVGHQGEPRDCWLPHDQIVVKYVRDYFIEHPQYHMYLQPEMPSYEDQLRARDNMLEKNKGISFIGAHLASLEWSVVELAGFLDRFPFALVDMAARVGDLQYQTISNREGVRQFFLKYQDRLLYATDTIQPPGVNAVQFEEEVHKKWLDDWKYLCTDSTFEVADVEDPVRGLNLKKTVVDKIYRTNAQRVFHAAHQWSSDDEPVKE
jgi:Amidohydrolase